MGYKRAGYRVVGNCEIDPRIAEVYDANLHPPRSYVMDIRQFNALEDLPDELYDLDVLDGSPPCSTFSEIGDREKAWGVEKQFAEGQTRQRLDDLFFVFLDTVAKLRPRAFVAENVKGLLVGNARGYVNEIVAKSRALGYDVQIFKLNAAFMGVPQRRERVFFIGNRMGWPRLELSFGEEPVTFGEVRSREGGRPIPPSVMELMPYHRPSDPDLGNAAIRKLGYKKLFSWRVAYDNKVAKTLTADECMSRAVDNTMLSVEDLRNISSFPQDYDFGKSSPNFICGMSVPPSMMANIAREIRDQWLDGRQ